MANSETGEKTEEATPKRIREARKKGQVAKSQDLTSMALFVAAFAVLSMSINYISQNLQGFMQNSFVYANRIPSLVNKEVVNHLLLDAITVMGKVLMPFLAVVFAMAVVVNFSQVGPLLTGHPLMPQLTKLNPITGFKQKFFSAKTYIELAKTLIKLIIVSILIYLIIKGALRLIVLSIGVPLWRTVELVEALIYKIVVQVSIAFIVIAVADFFYQRYQYKKGLRMSKYEVKKEYKEEEGDPTHKAARQRLHREISFQDMIQAVKKADVIIINPHQIAVAIQYDQNNMNAPQVISKGERLIAEKIKEIAKEYKIPIVQNIPLAHSLMELEIGEEIPEELYEAVAEVLNFVYKLVKEKEGV
ncbi:MAG: EscU/YscU/HrcU family type III secretion system export apparatus switch protein [bacterium]